MNGTNSSTWKQLPPGIRSRPTAPTGSQYRLLAELVEYVRAFAAERPLVIVLDEMQYADSTSWDALEYLLSQIDTDRILICLAQRPDSGSDTSSPHRQMLSRHDIAREMTILSRLTRDDVKRWLEAAFHRQQVGREFLAFLYRHTEGNPLFIAHVLRALIEEGAIWHSDTRWEWSPVSELRLPASRNELISQRLSRFSSSTQAVLVIAAIVGREFDVGLLVAAGAGSEPAVKLAVSEAVTAGLLRPTYERRNGAFAFTHDEIADVLIESIPHDRERQLHARVALALERRHADRAGEIALHFDSAGERSDAYRAAQAAAKLADRVYAHGAAGLYLQIAARNATNPAELAEIRVALAHVAETGGRFDEVEELCDLAIEWFIGQADDHRALTLRRMRERAHGTRPAGAKDARRTRHARRRGERGSVSTASVSPFSRWRRRRTADWAKCVLPERLAGEGVDMAERMGDRSLLGEALYRLGNSLVAEAPTRARTAYARALDLFEAIGDVRGQGRAHCNIGIAAQFEGKLDQASQAFARGIVSGSRRGHAGHLGTFRTEPRRTFRSKARRLRSRPRTVRRSVGALRRGETQRVSAGGTL